MGLMVAACGVDRAPATVVVVLPTPIATKVATPTRLPTQVAATVGPTNVPTSEAATLEPDGQGGGGSAGVLVIDFNASPAKVHLLDPTTGVEQSALDVPGLRIDTQYVRGGDFIFFYDLDAKVVKRIGFDGQVTELPFVNSGGESFDVRFLPSPDGSQIAWGTNAFDPANGNASRSTLNIANVDGSNLQTVLDKSLENQSILPEPIQWSQDGKTLYFTNEPYGIGGYILFRGGPDLQKVDVATGTVTPILDDLGCLCAMSIAPDGSMVARIIGVEPLVLVLHDIATGKEQTSNLAAGHLQAGDILWSADQKSLVYTLAVSNPDSEKYAIVQVDTATLKQTTLVPDDERLLYTVEWPDSNLIWAGDKDSQVWLLAPDTGVLAAVGQGGIVVAER